YQNFIASHPLHKDHEISYRYDGKGEETILLLLGGSMFPSEAYFRLIQALENHVKVLTIIYPKNVLSIEHLTRLIDDLLKKLELNQVFIMGASHGGGVAQVFSSHYQDKVKGLILYN